jgi:chemotaxis protein methyltransferase CheR
VIPALIESRRSVSRLRLWSAAASSGQEAYSLAMMLMDMRLDAWDVQILATDFSTQMVERTRTASYSQFEVNRGLPASNLVRYFNRVGREWQIKDAVKRWVRPEQHDLRQQMNRFGPFDLVMCRNVLIYFDVPTKQGILRQVRNTMAAGAYLALGGAETTLNLETAFARQVIGQATFYQAAQERKLG